MAYSNVLVKAQALNASIHKMWSDGITSAQKQISNIMDVVNLTQSDGPEGVYIMADTISVLRDRDDSDAMIPDAIQAYETTVTNKRKYRRIEVPLPALLDDKVGQYAMRARQLGKLVVTGPALDLEKYAENADSVTGFDGVAFFSASHPTNKMVNGSPTWSNKIVKGAGLTFDTFQEGLLAMRKFPDADGVPCGSQPTHLLVPSDWEVIANDIAKSVLPYGASGGGNKVSLSLDDLKVIVVKSWTKSQWMLVDASDEIERPFIFQEREPVELVDICTDPRSQWAIDHDRLAWGVQGRYGMGVGYPTKAALFPTA